MGCHLWGHTESDTTERLHFHFSPSCIGEGNGNPLQCSCLENPRDRGAWRAAVSGVVQSQTRLKQLSSSSNCHLSLQENSVNLYCLFYVCHILIHLLITLAKIKPGTSVVLICILFMVILSLVQFLVTPQTVALQAPPSGGCPGENTGVGCHSLLQGIFLTQESNPSLLHWQAGPLPPSHQESPLHMSKAEFIFFFQFLANQLNKTGLSNIFLIYLQLGAQLSGE